MKVINKIGLLVVVLLLASAQVFGQLRSITVPHEYNYNIIENNSNANRIVELRNIIDKSIELEISYCSCPSCFKKLDISPKILKPNEIAKLEFEYDLNKIGEFRESIYIDCKSEGILFDKQTITIKGEVKLNKDFNLNSDFSSIKKKLFNKSSVDFIDITKCEISLDLEKEFDSKDKVINFLENHPQCEDNAIHIIPTTELRGVGGENYAKLIDNNYQNSFDILLKVLLKKGYKIYVDDVTEYDPIKAKAHNTYYYHYIRRISFCKKENYDKMVSNLSRHNLVYENWIADSIKIIKDRTDVVNKIENQNLLSNTKNNILNSIGGDGVIWIYENGPWGGTFSTYDAYLVYSDGSYRFKSDWRSNLDISGMKGKVGNAPIVNDKKLLFKDDAIYYSNGNKAFNYIIGSQNIKTINKGLEFQFYPANNMRKLIVSNSIITNLGRNQFKVIFKDGSTYEGQMINGEPSGYGIYIGSTNNFNAFGKNTSKFKYEGNWKEGKLSGNGSLSRKQFVGHDGTSILGAMSGTEIWVKWTGNFIDGRMEGEFIGTNSGGDLNYKAKIIYKEGEEISYETITDEYYEERLKNAQTWNENIQESINSSNSSSNSNNTNSSKSKSSNSKNIEFREIKTNKENCGGYSYRLFDVYKNGSNYKTLKVVSHNDEWWSSCPFDCTFCRKLPKSKYSLKQFLIFCQEGDDGKADNYTLTEL